MTGLPQDNRKREHKVVRRVGEFDCLHFVQYILSPQCIGCKQTGCKKIYRMNIVTSLNPLFPYDELTCLERLYTCQSQSCGPRG